jgi:hypothetical protein
LIVVFSAQIMDSLSEFYDKLDTMKMFHCQFCKERWFDKEQAEKGWPGECTACFTQRTKRGGARHHHFSAVNDLDPIPHGRSYPFHLPELHPTEQQLIAPAYVVMRAYRMEKGNYGYKGQCLNLQQNIQDVADSLPQRVEDLPICWIRKRNQQTPEGHRDFRVRRAAVREWLVWLKANNPLYSNIEINTEEIDALPEDGDVLGRVATYIEDEEETAATEGEEANAEVEVDENGEDESDEYAEDEDVPMNLNGPDQGGATGNIENENGQDNVTSGFIGIPANETNRSVREEMHDILKEQFGTRENPIEWPAQAAGNGVSHTVPLWSG